MSQPVFKDGLGYEGKVTLTLKSNNRVLKSQVYKNRGTARLFKFLGHCLINDYAGAKNYLPTKILLLHNSGSAPESKFAADSKVLNQRSSWQGLSQQPTLISESDTEQVRVIYSFEVPRTARTGTFNQVALYSAGVQDHEITHFSAYYFLEDGDGNFDNQNVNDWTATTVLLIEWELILSNKNSEANNSNNNSTNNEEGES